jgi:IS30 family transposase
MKKYQHLTQEQRYEIYYQRKNGDSLRSIGASIGVSASTVSRELQRNTGKRGYRPQQAEQLYQERKHQRPKSLKRIKFTPCLQERICSLLQEYWSPQQITGYLQAQKEAFVSPERIYQHIWQDKRNSGTLWTYLRVGSKKYRKRRNGKCSHNKDMRGHIADRVSIEERPAMVDAKERIGDWEVDTVIGKQHKGVLVTAVERKTKFSLVCHVANREAQRIADAIIAMLTPYQLAVHTITVDNGKEFALHKSIAKTLSAKVFFAHPYCSYERGVNENTNGLIRQFFPKSMHLSDVSEQDTHRVQTLLNSRPRKTLDFQSPDSLFLNHIASVALVT